jgi:CRISPR-associated protein Cas5d
MTTLQQIEVWGDFGCFTRPELKVERLSYPFITPSAARGIFDAIYWKPAFRWIIRQIEILSPPSYIALRRNEVQTNPLSDRTIKSWISGEKDVEPLFADEDRTQRQTIALRRPHYRISAQIRPRPERAGELPSMIAQFRRRAGRGQCFHQPSFGCREFPAYFRLIEPGDSVQAPVPIDIDVGWMVFDTFAAEGAESNMAPPTIQVFHAVAVNGILEVPLPESSTIRRPQGG